MTCVVVYAYHSPNYKVKGLFQVSEAVEDGLRTIRIRYRSPSTLGYSPISPLDQGVGYPVLSPPLH